MRRSFRQDEIESTLRALGVAFQRHGEVAGQLAFASLRAPCAAGVYYLAGDACLPAEVTDSLVIAADPPSQVDSPRNAWLLVDNPQRAFYQLMDALVASSPEPGVHPTAIVDPTVVVPRDATVGPYCVIEADVAMGDGCTLDAHVVLKRGTRLGAGVTIEAHTIVGATGVAWIWNDTGTRRIVQPQTGGVSIGDRVFLGSGVTVVRGSVNESTDIGDDTVVSHGTRIGHGCRVGKLSHLANNVALAGNVDAGAHVFFGSGCVVHPKVRIADGAVIGAGAVINRDIEEPNCVMGAITARRVGTHDRKLRGMPAPPPE